MKVEASVPRPNPEAVRAGDLVFFGGIVARVPGGGIEAPFDAGRQTLRIVERIRAYLELEGMGLENLVFVTVYIPDIRLFDAMNAAYSSAMPAGLPARKLVVTPLTVEGAVVEMTGIASAQAPRVVPGPDK